MQSTIITIGDEILIGQVVDTNSAWMAQQLNLQGIQIKSIYSVGDTAEAIRDALKEALAQSDLVLITGGLGPTKDDITKKTLADFFGVGMAFHQPTYDRILRMFERWGREPTEAHRLQCDMPENAELLFNKMGSAPGMWFEMNEKVVVSMPGVPYEMKYIMEHGVLPKLKSNFPLSPIAHRTILTIGEGESRIANRIEDFEQSLPQQIKLAYLPGMGRVRLRLTATGSDEQALSEQLDIKVDILKEVISELIYGYGDESLEAVIGQLLKDRGKTFATAESCTGGYVAHLITSVPGSSAYFKGSIIAYSNEVKEKQLKVKRATLEAHGAVSEATVIEMVKGALDALEVDIAVAISGIAGPDGGSEEKPVGTIWVAVGNEERIITHKSQLGKDRLKNIQFTGIHVLNMVRKFLLEQ